MKKINLLTLLFLALAFGFTACDETSVDPDGNEGNDNGNVVITDNITENTTWTSDNVYQLGGRIVVEAGAELTIEAGTIIKGEAGSQANASALIIARDGKLFANGTADEPIIFTSVADEIQPGQIASPNLDPTQNGLWGGVIILGNAPISASADEVQIEGIPTSDPNGLYGGTDAADNSGEIRYISIRHGGTNIGAGNEINGLTLGGVGSGTVIENVEVVANQDDGIEWFGGTVNVTNAVVWNAGDDGMDTDQSWSGTMDNFLVVTPTGHCFELDGPEGDVLLDVQHTFSNGTVIASNDARQADELINTDENSGVILENIFITGIVEGQIINRPSAANITYTNVILDVTTDLTNYIPAGATVPAGIVAGTNAQADASVFANWTWADVAADVSSL
ncbi:hypothetical protein [Marivirga sp.]|uniref:hypothetical protein n=1 Tax=Marivirga sp. TaxID=2018662 RepID=UPI002D7E1A63|nr:hypothetical protein [Marivirga sp.]HET8858567.1 hypothetical protein [Marivirga sp.]